METLQKGVSYSVSSNIFAKCLLITQQKEFFPMIICENQKQAQLYQKIFDVLDKECGILESIGDIFELFKREKIYVTPVEKIGGFSQYLLEKKYSITLKKEQKISIETLLDKLSSLGYTFSEASINGTFKRQGDTLHIVPFFGKQSYIISFWGDIIENIQKTNFYLRDKIILKNQQGGSIPQEFPGILAQEIDTLKLGSNKTLSEIAGDEDMLKYFFDAEVNVIFDGLDFHPKYEKFHSYPTGIFFDLITHHTKSQKHLGLDDIICESVEDLLEILKKKKTVVYTKNPHIIKNFAEFHNLENILIHEVDVGFLKSFSRPDCNYICDDILLKIFARKRVKKRVTKDYDLLLKISVGDYVVHMYHGIGIYKGIVKKQLHLSGKDFYEKEYLQIEYKDNDMLYVPITEVERITKYVGVDNPELTDLGGDEWTKKLAKVDRDVQKIAQELLEIYAQRAHSKASKMHIDTEKLEEFQKQFPYTYTQDQVQSIGEILEDLQSEKSMDRILIGDVGFGKTEVAFNALYQAVCNKKQCILIAPLVVLAYEHYQKAQERFAGTGTKIGILTRLESQANVTKTLRALKNGEIDILIGTHRVLSEKIEYRDLGLIVIDEEHKFGVEDKEKIKKLKHNIHCLAMSATPIPRSLNMALAGIRSISTLREAPMGRKDIKTFVIKYDENTIFQACEKEFARGGQVFFIHNRVENIVHMGQILQSIFPKKKIVITHGQLHGDELEDRILEFKEKKYDILLSTTVIENGIDFGNVNTIFINECQNFGLSQIHQLRGRVGRSEKEGYCYLMYRHDALSEDSVKRLKTIVKYSYLGSGFELAIRDLEIRGGGDVLGIRQSGQKTDIGINLYLQLLEERVETLKQSPDRQVSRTDLSIDLQVEALIPDVYFNGETDKLNFYREIESVSSSEDVENILQSFLEINPQLPQSVKNLFALLELKILLGGYSITSLKKVGIHYQIDFTSNITTEKLKSFLELDKDTIFHIVSIDKIRTPKKDFGSDEEFLYYLLDMCKQKIHNKKIRLKHI